MGVKKIQHKDVKMKMNFVFLFFFSVVLLLPFFKMKILELSSAKLSQGSVRELAIAFSNSPDQ